MIHLDDEQVQRFLHDELTPTAAASLKHHLATCGQCQHRITDEGREEEQLFGLLGRVDHPAPTIEVSAVMPRLPTQPFLTRWAAVGLLGVCLAGAAYAIPGSPVQDWLRALVTRATPAPERPVVPRPLPETPAGGGVAVPPGGNFEVRFLSVQPTGEIRVTLTNGDDLVVQARGEGAQFTSSADRLVIDNRRSAGDFDIVIPNAALRVEIRIGDRRVLLKDRSRIFPAMPDSGPSRIPLKDPAGTSP